MTRRDGRHEKKMMDTSSKETAAVIEPETEVKTMACQEMEAYQEEKKPTSQDRKPEAAQKAEVPADNATVMPVGKPKKKQRRDRKLAAERRRQKPKTSTREYCGPQKRLAVALRGTSCREKVTRHTKEIGKKMSSRATVARRKRDIAKHLTQGAGEFPRKRLVAADKKMTRCANVTHRKRPRLQGDQLDPRTSPHKDMLERAREELGSRKGHQAGNRERTLGISSRLRKIRKLNLWRGRSPPKRKKQQSK
jgi:hypothetical protein